MAEEFNLIVIGAGSGGLTAAEFAAKLGVKVALIEKERIGGDCTWTGCVPSKALLKVAKVAHQARTAAQYGLCVEPPKADMAQIYRHIQQVIADVYQRENPDVLTAQGIDLIFGPAQFLDAQTLQVGEQTLKAKKYIIATGAHPFVPPIPSLSDVPYLTYLDIFETQTLPNRFIIIGAGPIGAEIAQAYGRLGSQVTLIDVGLMPNEEPEVAATLGQVFEQEGIRFVKGLVSQVQQEGDEIIVTVEEQAYRGDRLLVAVGRRANVQGLALDAAGIAHGSLGIEVDPYLRTNIKHIYAIGDCVKGNYQFTHLAGWQGAQAVRNALLPGHTRDGLPAIVPWTTFTDPEVAHVGLTEAQAHDRHRGDVRVTMWPLDHLDRAVADHATIGFIKVVHTRKGKLLGATIMAERAGELITEFAIALRHNLKLFDLANVIHPYPTYSVGLMQLAGDVAVDNLLAGTMGKVIKGLVKLTG